MLNSSIRNYIRTLACELGKFTNYAISRYLYINNDKLMKILGDDYPGNLHNINNYFVSFVNPDFPEFLFVAGLVPGENPKSETFAIHGRGNFSGFLLQFADHRLSFATIDSPNKKATAQAKC